MAKPEQTANQRDDSEHNESTPSMTQLAATFAAARHQHLNATAAAAAAAAVAKQPEVLSNDSNRDREHLAEPDNPHIFKQSSLGNNSSVPVSVKSHTLQASLNSASSMKEAREEPYRKRVKSASNGNTATSIDEKVEATAPKTTSTLLSPSSTSALYKRRNQHAFLLDRPLDSSSETESQRPGLSNVSGQSRDFPLHMSASSPNFDLLIGNSNRYSSANQLDPTRRRNSLSSHFQSSIGRNLGSSQPDNQDTKRAEPNSSILMTRPNSKGQNKVMKNQKYSTFASDTHSEASSSLSFFSGQLSRDEMDSASSSSIANFYQSHNPMKQRLTLLEGISDLKSHISATSMSIEVASAEEGLRSQILEFQLSLFELREMHDQCTRMLASFISESEKSASGVNKQFTALREQMSGFTIIDSLEYRIESIQATIESRTKKLEKINKWVAKQEEMLVVKKGRIQKLWKFGLVMSILGFIFVVAIHFLGP